MKSVDLHGCDLLDMMQSVQRGVIPSSSKVIPLFLQPPLFWEFHPPDLSTYPSAPVPLGGRQSLTIINRLKRLTIMHTSMNFIFPAKLDLITSKQILISF